MSYLATMELEMSVFPIFKERGTEYRYYQKETEAMVIFKDEKLTTMTYFVFLKFVAPGNRTSMPTVENSLSGHSGKNRISVGEWIVEKIYKMEDATEELIQKLANGYSN